MPDLVTHFAAAYVLRLPSRWSRFRVPFYLGAILPDLLTRPVHIIYPKAVYVVQSIHTPIVSALACFLIAQFFDEAIRRKVTLNLLLGVTLHLGLDLLQRQIIAGYYWLFPFSWKSFDLGVFWPEEALRMVPVWLGIIVIIEAVVHMRKRTRDGTSR